MKSMEETACFFESFSCRRDEIDLESGHRSESGGWEGGGSERFAGSFGVEAPSSHRGRKTSDPRRRSDRAIRGGGGRFARRRRREEGGRKSWLVL